MMKRFFILISSSVLFISCQEEPLQVDLGQVERESHFRRFDAAFFESDTANFTTELRTLKKDFPLFYESGGTDRFWKEQRLDDQQISLYTEVQEIMPGMDVYDQKLNRAMKHFYYYFPQHPDIDFYTYISNLDFNYPVLYNPERKVCFVATDLYLGADQVYYQYLPRYLAYERQPKFMIRDVMASIGETQLPPKAENASLLDLMVRNGKLLYFLEAMMPQEEKDILIKYTPQHLNFCRLNERNIWVYFIENNLLFSTKDDVIRRFIDPAPFSKFGMKFDNETPGRIGHWLGWQIIRAYMEENPEVSLQEMLREKDSRKILKLSSYKP